MDFSIAAQLLIFVLTVVYILSPYFWVAARPKRHRHLSAELKRNLEKKEHLLLNLKDLDFEFEMGKVSREDHERLSAYYRAQIIIIMKKVDRLREVAEKAV